MRLHVVHNLGRLFSADGSIPFFFGRLTLYLTFAVPSFNVFWRVLLRLFLNIHSCALKASTGSKYTQAAKPSAVPSAG